MSMMQKNDSDNCSDLGLVRHKPLFLSSCTVPRSSLLPRMCVCLLACTNRSKVNQHHI